MREANDHILLCCSLIDRDRLPDAEICIQDLFDVLVLSNRYLCASGRSFAIAQFSRFRDNDILMLETRIKGNVPTLFLWGFQSLVKKHDNEIDLDDGPFTALGWMALEVLLVRKKIEKARRELDTPDPVIAMGCEDPFRCRTNWTQLWQHWGFLRSVGRGFMHSWEVSRSIRRIREDGLFPIGCEVCTECFEETVGHHEHGAFNQDERVLEKEIKRLYAHLGFADDEQDQRDEELMVIDEGEEGI